MSGEPRSKYTEGAYKNIVNEKEVPERYISKEKELLISTSYGFMSGMVGIFSPILLGCLYCIGKADKKNMDRKYRTEIDKNFIKRLMTKTIGVGVATYLSLYYFGAQTLSKIKPTYYKVPVKSEEIDIICNKGLDEKEFKKTKNRLYSMPVFGIDPDTNLKEEKCMVKTKDGNKIEFYVPKDSTEEEIIEEAAEKLAEEEVERHIEKENFEKRIRGMKKQLMEELEQKYREML